MVSVTILISFVLSFEHMVRVSHYTYDGLAVIHQANGSKTDRIRKDIMALFKYEELSIIIYTNLIETDFLDVSFNLEMDKFCPDRKRLSLHPF